MDVVFDMSGGGGGGAKKSLLRLDLKLKRWPTFMLRTCNNKLVQRRLGKNAHMIAL